MSRSLHHLTIPLAVVAVVASGYDQLSAQEGSVNVESVFEFRFPTEASEEGLALVVAVGNDMTSLKGYVDHEVIRDVEDPGHLMVATRWVDRQRADAVLGEYQHDEKLARIDELIPDRPDGFVGDVVSPAS